MFTFAIATRPQGMDGHFFIASATTSATSIIIRPTVPLYCSEHVASLYSRREGGREGGSTSVPRRRRCSWNSSCSPAPVSALRKE